MLLRSYHKALLSFLCFLGLNVFSIETVLSQDTKTFPGGGVQIEKKTLKKKNPGYDEEEYGTEGPWEKYQIIKTPAISGMKDIAVQEKINHILGPEEILKGYEDSLNTADYEVHFNRDHILSLTFTLGTAGATGRRSIEFNRNIDLRTGRLITAAEAFTHSKIDKLLMLVKRLKTREENKAAAELSKDHEYGNHFKIADLNNFYIDDKGLTFVYNYDIRGSLREGKMPIDHYFISYEELKVYINPEGPLGIFVK